MKHELTNLLPRERTRAFRQQYFLRLLTVAGVLGIVLVVVHGLLLLPTYLLLTGEAQEAQKELATLKALENTENKDEASKKLEELNTQAKRLESVLEYKSATEVIESLLKAPLTGISLSRISYVPPTLQGEGRLVVSGTALSRSALDTFVKELKKNTRFSVVDLPISAYAKETNLDFTISISGDFTP